MKRRAKLKRPAKRRLVVPIYDAEVWVVVADDIAAERRKWEPVFGPAPAGHDYDALCSYDAGPTFALFFRRSVTLPTVAHEVFHLTHRILEWVQAGFDPDHHEPGAYLHGFLMDEVCRAVLKMIDADGLPLGPGGGVAQLTTGTGMTGVTG